MKICNNCNNKITDDSDFCKFCGFPQHENASLANELDDRDDIISDAPSGRWNSVQLFWSIMNIVIGVCMPIGVVALIQTDMAKKAATVEEESRRLKIAGTCNIIGIALTAGFFILIVSLILFQ